MITKPLFFEHNRVFRVYLGGKLFEKFMGEPSEDCFFPEEWVASAVKALNKEKRGEHEGVSQIKDSELYLDELVRDYPTELLGSKGKMRILVKYLDSAIRLPAQAHPDKPFSRKYFNSDYGKTESWIVLDTRPGAKIYFGFKDGVTKEMFNEAIDASENDKDAMERLLNYYEPKKGDVILVPAKTIHAIGAGCLILEVQEPTDFTIQPEHWCGDYKLDDGEMYIGLPREVALQCFEFGSSPDGMLTPKVAYDRDGVKLEHLITPEDTECFVIDRITLTGGEYALNLNDSYGVYIVTEGSGKIVGDGYEKDIKMGDYFLMPAAAMGKFTVTGKLELVECY